MKKVQLLFKTFCLKHFNNKRVFYQMLKNVYVTAQAVDNTLIECEDQYNSCNINTIVANTRILLA